MKKTMRKITYAHWLQSIEGTRRKWTILSRDSWTVIHVRQTAANLTYVQFLYIYRANLLSLIYDWCWISVLEKIISNYKMLCLNSLDFTYNSNLTYVQFLYSTVYAVSKLSKSLIHSKLSIWKFWKTLVLFSTVFKAVFYIFQTLQLGLVCPQ